MSNNQSDLFLALIYPYPKKIEGFVGFIAGTVTRFVGSLPDVVVTEIFAYYQPKRPDGLDTQRLYLSILIRQPKNRDLVFIQIRDALIRYHNLDS